MHLVFLGFLFRLYRTATACQRKTPRLHTAGGGKGGIKPSGLRIVRDVGERALVNARAALRADEPVIIICVRDSAVRVEPDGHGREQGAQQHPAEEAQIQHKQLPLVAAHERCALAQALPGGLLRVVEQQVQCLPVAIGRDDQNKKVLLRGGIFCGVALFAASAAQQMGIGTTSTAKAGFMTALYVVLVPVAGVFLGSRPGVKLWCCVAASVVGLYLLCLAGRDTLSLTGGEWQLLVCAILFTAQIMLVNHFSPQLDGIQLSFVQFFVVSVLSTIFAFVFEAPSPDQFRAAAVSIAYCGIMSSGVAYTLQIVGQKVLDPTIASLAMCLESVFSALAGWLILGETLSATELCGCALMFGAIVVSQLPEKRLKG